MGQIWSQIEKLVFLEIWDVPWRISMATTRRGTFKYITGEIRGFLAHGGPQEPAPPARELEMCLWSAPGNKLNSSAQHGALRAT